MILEGGEESRYEPHVPQLIWASVTVEHWSGVGTFHTEDSLKSGYHLFDSFLEVSFRQLKQLRQSLYLLIEEPIGSLLAKLDDCFGFTIMKGFGVLWTEHVDDGIDNGGERKPRQPGDLLTVVEEFIDWLDTGLLHLLFGREGTRVLLFGCLHIAMEVINI